MTDTFEELREALADRYDVSRDGERFLKIKLPPEQIRLHINVVLNWFDELRTRVPR